MNDFPELTSFDADFQPTKSKFALNVEALPNGAFNFRIASAELTRTEKTNELLLRMHLDVESGPMTGTQVEHVYFFRTQKQVDRSLGGDLITLGFDVDKWTLANGKPFSRELQNAIPRLRGIKFMAKKETNTEDGKTYHNLRINARLHGAAMPAAANGPPVSAAPAAAQVTAAATTQDDPRIPF